jgi:mono/diheme cytochrome c family protein
MARRPISLLCLALAVIMAGCGRGLPPRTRAKRTTPTTAEKTAPGNPASAPAGSAVPAQAASAPAASVLPLPDLGYNAREGRALYRHYCLTCHGEEGHGDGFNAYNLDPKPRDLADPAFQAKRTDEDLVAVIRSGGGVAGLSTGMPPWGRTLSERKIRNIVDYLRTLPAASK